MRHKNIILGALLALAAHVAGAQTVWRCGNSYGTQPCPGGTPVSSSDARTPADAQRATRVANSDAKLASEMEKARLAQERNAPKALVIGGDKPLAGEEPRPEEKKLTKSGKPEFFTARAPRAPGEKKKPKKRKKAT